MFNISTIRANKSAEIITWQNRVITAGGGFESNSLVIANRFLTVFHGRNYHPKIKYLLSGLGAGINAMRIPLVDVLNVGGATNTNFVDADFSQSTGLQGDGTSKYLDSLIKPSQLGSSNNGGLGWWENNINLSGNVEPMGVYNTGNTQRFVIDLRSNVRSFRWGDPVNSAGDTATAGNGHYYGQRSGATNRIFDFDAASVGTNSTSDTASGAADRNILIAGANSTSVAPWPGRCALAYMTDGTLDSDEISDFNVVLRDYLMAPTGKPQS